MYIYISILLSRELFWKGYNIWNKRKRLTSKFWTEIAPPEWRVHNGKKENKKSNKVKKKIEKKPYPCQNIFHFLKRHSDLSQKLPTPCPCSNILKRKRKYKSIDMRDFITIVPHNSTIVFTDDINTEAYTTREDLVRGAHDRGKKADSITT